MKKSHHSIYKAGASFMVALLLVLAGCAVPKAAPDIQQETPAAFRNETADTSTESIATLPWKQIFAGQELAALIDTALIKNNDLQIAIKDIATANELYKKSRQGYMPQVNVRVTSSNSIPSNNSLNGLTADQFLGTNNLDDYNANIGISWEADIWGKVKSARQAALAQYLQTQEARKAVQTRLIASIASGYYNLLMLDMQLAIAHKNVLLGDSILRIVRLQYDAAQVSLLAVEQAEAQQQVAIQLAPQLEQAINIQENALSILAGVAPAAIRRSGTLDDLQLPASVATGLPAEMIGRRPDVKASELALQAATARIGMARANFYPSISIGAAGGVNSLKASNWFNLPASLFGVVTGGITAPVLQQRALKTQYNVAVIQREQSVLRFRQSVLTAYAEVADALVRIDKLDQQRTAAQVRVDKLQQATANAGLLFRNGQANYLEVITAQSNVLSGELQLANIKREQLSAVVELYRSLGGGWK